MKTEEKREADLRATFGGKVQIALHEGMPTKEDSREASWLGYKRAEVSASAWEITSDQNSSRALLNKELRWTPPEKGTFRVLYISVYDKRGMMCHIARLKEPAEVRASNGTDAAQGINLPPGSLSFMES